MNGLKPRRPSPALVLAAIALFASLGGTGYAATRLAGSPEHPARAAKAKPLTKKQVNKLIAKYFASHRSQLRGPAGAPGTAGTQGVQGVQGIQGAAGPGATRIAASQTGNTAATSVATVGPWTVSLACTSSGIFNAMVSIAGPGDYWATKTLAVANGPAAQSSEVNGLVTGGSPGFSVPTTDQLAETTFLGSGSTLAELNLQATATASAGVETCTLVGDAIPVA